MSPYLNDLTLKRNAKAGAKFVYVVAVKLRTLC